MNRKILRMIMKNRAFPILPRNILATNCVCVGRSMCERQTERDREKQKKIPAFLNPD